MRFTLGARKRKKKVLQSMLYKALIGLKKLKIGNSTLDGIREGRYKLTGN